MQPPRQTESLGVIDSHTAGEPTRTVVSGLPDLGGGPVAQQFAVLRERHDWVRTSLINEPRGSDIIVGAAICPASDPACAAGVIFFNNAGYLRMCGHGAIGVAATLAHLGRIGPGVHRLETAVGVVAVQLHEDGRVSLENVPSYRHRRGVTLSLPAGQVTGDIVWGGNWFFMTGDHGQRLEMDNIEALMDYCWSIREALSREGVTGGDGWEIDHIELFGPPRDETADALGFVLCPGRAYDRSPCGTGTSAKVACLAEDGLLPEGEIWRQQSIIGGVFEATYRREGEKIIPTVTGRAYVNADTTVVFDPGDPFRFGIAAS